MENKIRAERWRKSVSMAIKYVLVFDKQQEQDVCYLFNTISKAAS